MEELTPELLAIIAGALLSLLMAYVPGLNTWYDNLKPTHKRLTMLVLLALSAVGVFAYACTGRTDLTTCDAAGGWQLLEFFIAAMIANQSAFLIAPKRNKGAAVDVPQEFLK